MKKDQHFSTRYKWAEPMYEFRQEKPAKGRRADAYLIVAKDDAAGTRSRIYVPDLLVPWVLEKGGIVVYETLPEDYSAALDALEASLNARCEGEGRGAAYVSRIMATVRVETPTALGKEEHFARRALVEAWLRGRGLAFEVECATLHSDLLCQPLPPGALDAVAQRAASPAPGGDGQAPGAT